MFDCKKLHSKCQAMCCNIVPFSQERWDRNQNKIVTQPKRIMPAMGPTKCIENGFRIDLEGDIIPETETGKCPFLRKDLLCNIYEDRPEVCKIFGTESHVMMKCNFQDKNGNIRSRQANRKILREQEKWTNNLINRFKLL